MVENLPANAEDTGSITDAGRSCIPRNNWAPAAAAAKSLQSCPTLCDPIEGSPPGSPVPGILQARTLEWVAISFSNAGKWKVKVKSLRRVWLLATPRTAAHQAPPSMGSSRQEYWSGVPLLSPDWAPTPQLLTLSSRARELQLLSPRVTAMEAPRPTSASPSSATREAIAMRSLCSTAKQQPLLNATR